LNLRLENFENQLGLNRLGQPCVDKQTHRCATYFRFCLKISTKTCLAELRTDFLGENSISNEQFKMTTDSIEFLIKNKYLTNANRIVLLIQAYHTSSSVGELEELINEWSLPVKNKQSSKLLNNLNEWNEFESTNGNHFIQFSYQLKCSKNYYGSMCSERSPVLSQIECNLECKNGATCIMNPSTLKPMCKCSSNDYEGDLCQIRVVHQCSSNEACLNGASCLANGECLCAPGYTGDKCQTKRLPNQCGPVTCLNGGVCVIDNQNEYTCKCEPSFTGHFCQIAAQFKTLPSTKQSHLTKDDSSSLSSKEICLIVLLGVGLPVMFILLAILILRNRTRSTANDQDQENNVKKIHFENLAQHDHQQKQTKPYDFIDNNLFDAEKADLTEKKLCINTISGLLSLNSNSKININTNITSKSISNSSETLKPKLFTYLNNSNEKKTQEMYLNNQGSYV